MWPAGGQPGWDDGFPNLDMDGVQALSEASLTPSGTMYDSDDFGGEGGGDGGDDLRDLARCL